MRVFLHTRSPGQTNWDNTPETFKQIPRVGDYIARTSDSSWYLVELVVWLPESAKTKYQVEINAVQIDHKDAMRLARRTSDATVEAAYRTQHPD